MRGGFNNTLAVRYGPRSVAGVPGDIWAVDIPCRRVAQIEISQDQLPFDLSEVWVTFDELDVNGPMSVSPFLGAVFTDYMTADQVSFADAPGVWYAVCRAERVVPPLAPPYWRYMLIPDDWFAVPPWPEPKPIPPAPPGLDTVGVSVEGVQNLDTDDDPTITECEVFSGYISDVWTIDFIYIGINSHGNAVGSIDVLKNGVVVGSMVNQFHETPAPTLLGVNYGTCPV